MKIVLPAVLLIIQFLYTKDLVQKNPEELFLNDSGRESLIEYKRQFPSKNFLLAFIKTDSLLEGFKKIKNDSEELLSICNSKCDVLLPNHLYKDEDQFLNSLKTNSIKEKTLVTKDSIGLVVLTDQSTSYDLKQINYLLEQGYELAGHGYINYLLDEYSKLIQERIFPLVFIMSFIFVLLITKSVLNSVILFYMPLFSSLLSLTVIKLVFVNMNMIISIIPLITFIISLSISLHLYFTAIKYNSFKRSFTEKSRPIFLMVITTFIGFASLGVSNIGVIRHFGLLCSGLILFTSILSTLWLRTYESYFQFNNGDFSKSLNSFPRKTIPLKFIFAIVIGSGLLGYFGIMNVQTVTDASSYFDNKPSVRESIIHSKEMTGGVPLFDILIKKKAKNFEEFQRISDFEKQLKSIEGIDIVSDLNSVREINFEYSGQRTISANIFSFNALRSKIPAAINNNDLSDSSDYYKIKVLGTPVDVDQFMSTINLVKPMLTNFEYQLNGLFYNLMTSQKEMIQTLFLSFFISLSLMGVIVLLVFRSFKILISFFVVNLCPVAISIFLYSLFGLSLNIATVMTYSIGLGIVVDSSFHLYHSLENKNFSFENYFLTTLLPIISSTIILVLSFSAFVFYNFLPIREFGLSLSIIILLGFFFDTFVLPTICKGNHHLNT